MKMEETEFPETSAYKIQTSGNYPEESIQRSEHGESLKSSNTDYSYRTREVTNMSALPIILGQTFFQRMIAFP
jgi:hypothetical protein